MNDDLNQYLVLPAIRVNQPLGSFFVTRITARDLLRITFSNPLRIADDEGALLGNQRTTKKIRIKEIANYIDTVESAFPNSIILAANYDADGNLIEDSSIRWKIELPQNGENGEQPIIGKIVIPTSARVASIIDGQHRLNAFEFVNNPERLDTELLCSVYFDLPLSYQAYIFATINFNQKKVDKSLAYELFGYNLDDENPELWSPEKTAVFLTRKLNNDESSPFYNHIIVAPQNDNILFKVAAKQQLWYVSTATVVEGILSVISANPKKDRDVIHTLSEAKGRNRNLAGQDKSPLRGLYLSYNDLAVYTTIYNFFTACQNTLFVKANHNSYIFKTVGIQALFDFLKRLLDKTFQSEKDISVRFFEGYLAKVAHVDFSTHFFQASGIGRSRIRNLLLVATNLSDGIVSDIQEIRVILDDSAG